MLWVLKVFEEPLGESNTERRKFQKRAPNNIFIIKSQKLTRGGGGVKTYGVLIKLMNQNFSKSKFLHESFKLEHIQWEVKILDLSKV